MKIPKQLNKWFSKIDELYDFATELNLSYGSIYKINYDSVNFRKVCTHWIPRQLASIRKDNRLKIFQYLERNQEERGSLLKRVITVDETWIHHF